MIGNTFSRLAQMIYQFCFARDGDQLVLTHPPARKRMGAWIQHTRCKQFFPDTRYKAWDRDTCGVSMQFVWYMIGEATVIPPWKRKKSLGREA